MDSDYSFSLTTFSPSGKLVQIEYALNAVNSQGRPALGIKARNGVIIAAEKKVASPLVEEHSIRKVELITSEIGCCFAGMPADFRVILKKSRKIAQVYYNTYREQIPVCELVREIATVMQEFTQSGGVRPFGVSLLVAGFDSMRGPQLFQIDPSGAYFGWKASAVGKDMQNAKSFLEKRYNPDMEIEDALHTALLTLKECFEGAMNEDNIEVGIIGEDKNFTILTPREIKDYLGEVE
ncbi:proteasome subunit Alpha type 2 [Cryptosporidium ubiquitum]|uniref:Proteasome subunit alpha type n=1 Tax=Cryptosporidium ubiquitum TaxID=857276 RepID=A0A1J4MN75_9CRYT|nr:proteasome subunit Alpha type 2 [Cryptosporidium ubiquitum]OII74907.1 proteasome subunit Alpha type 2 [Cryptosporidium ubiquitum]